MNCCSPARNVDQSILQLNVDELELAAVQSEDLRVLRGRRIVRVPYLLQPVERGGANNSLFNRIGSRTVNNAVLITDIDRTLIKSSFTCTRPHMLRPLRSPPPFVSGFDNNPSVALADWPFHVCALIDMRVRSHFTSGAYLAHPYRRCAYSRNTNARASWLRLCQLLRFLYAGLIRVLSPFPVRLRVVDHFPHRKTTCAPPATATSYAASCHCVVLMHLETALSGPAVVVVGTRDAHERAAIVISSVRSLAGTGIEKRMYWFGTRVTGPLVLQEMPFLHSVVSKYGCRDLLTHGVSLPPLIVLRSRPLSLHFNWLCESERGNGGRQARRRGRGRGQQAGH
ncbi:hypothetical protein B0H13DRAFT_2536136 [Mycena leptocephala]|nr:hypothetical protein B0H13DRAFT_2536136 [Mycena leptocephala]